jgi:hypothetical protein
LTVASAAVLAIVGFLAATARADPAPGDVSFTTPHLFPRFAPGVHDYVVRCQDGPVDVIAHTAAGWEMAIGSHAFRKGDFTEMVPLGEGRSFTSTARRVGHTQGYRYYVRCLPSTFPTYTFTHQGPVSPKYFAVDQARAGPARLYGIIFDDNGVPIWWYHGPARDPRVLPGGNVLWFDRTAAKWQIHRLDGSYLGTLDSVGHAANDHDVQRMGNGDYLFGAYVQQSHVDTSAYGGSSDANVINAELQEEAPNGGLLWSWKSRSHIGLGETGRHWPMVIDDPQPEGYDLVHWNSIEPDGNAVVASFRQLDAVFKISKTTGNIIWKLGGTHTPKSLTVKGDSHTYTLGAQHDARVLPDGTVTVFDNRTDLGKEKQPRMARFRVNQQAGTATLVQSITDPKVAASGCCGSARRVDNGDWLIDWGGFTTNGGNPIAGYKPNGQRTFMLQFDRTFSYRAEPVPTGAVSAEDLRQAMNAMYAP